MKLKNKKLPALAAGTLVVGFVLGLGTSVQAKFFGQQDALPYEEVARLSTILERIKRSYVEEVDDATLIDNAINGMLSGLDPHSTYLSAKDFEDLQVSTSGKFGGLGIEVTMEDGFVKVVSPIDDTPAFKAGIQAGDLIIALDGEPVKGKTLTEAVSVMRGEPGEALMLTVVREGMNKTLEIKIIRDIISVKSVKNKMLEDDYGYIRVANFQSQTGNDVEKALAKLIDENDGKLKGLVLDLRNNPGGVLDGAVQVSDAFLEEGLIVYTEGRIANSEMRFNADSTDHSDGVNVVVLVNGGSASASEIVAGALQDHKRAVIMGTQTFGKGSVQTILPVSEDSAIKLTTARYFTPSGTSIQAQGITPDIMVDRAEIKRLEGKFFKESDLSNHLSNPEDDGPTAKDKVEQVTGEKVEEEAVEEDLASTDYQLFEALTLLKGAAVFSR